ncbi:aldehyde dehydrogenase [Cristinia sonorae]|uniref:Aldehyde dehydrogenase n=1 Tax=Cristinia sonorae TaxID=1940300 RepID=A0A8K0XN64_9AGAR|nr:aldehyde dehydrogenase [Cristinia sonorae]
MVRNIRARLPKNLSVKHTERYNPFAHHILTEGPMPQVTGGRTELNVKNPATGQRISTVVTASEEDVYRTVRDAHHVYQMGSWSKLPLIERSATLTILARDLEEVIPDLAKMESEQTGRAIREMLAQLSRIPEWLDYYAALLRTHSAFVAPTQGPLLNYVKRVPLGVVGQITPFNHPLLIAVKKIAPALAAGNSVIVKPSEHAPMSVLEFAELAVQAGLPMGVLSVLPGGPETGKALASNPLVRKVDITAGTNTGRQLGGIVGSNLASFTAELGGKAPIVVFDDADPEAAANGAAFACFVASGQTCISGSRLIVQKGIYDKFMSHFMKKVDSITRRMGNPLNPKSTMGSVISLHHLKRIEHMVQHERAGSGKILAGGHRMTGKSELDGFDFSKGSFFPPTVIEDVAHSDVLWREEVFGPVVVVKQFKDEAEGVALANDCRYGLGAGIWTENLSRGHRIADAIESGLVWVNTHHRNDPSSPWGGMKDSGIGRENGIEAFESYSQSKSTIINIASAEETRTVQDWFAEEEETERAEPKRYG